MTTHTTTITGKCPHGCPDVYEATFETTRVIPVEVIAAAVACFTASIGASAATVCANSRGATLIVSSAGCAIAAVHDGTR